MTGRRLNIVHFLARVRLEEGGVVRAVLDLVGALADAGHTVTLLTLDDTDAPPEWAGRDGPTVVRLPGGAGAFGRLGAGARAAVRERLRGADALHLHTPWEIANLACADEARRAGVRYVVSVHGMLDDWSMAQRTMKKRIYLALAGRRLLERASAVHCTAEAELTQARRYFPRGSGVVAPLLMDLVPFRDLPGPDDARAAFDIPAEAPVILFLSRIHEKKGVDVLLRAFAALRERRPDALLVIAGPGEASYVERMKALARELGMTGHVRFPGMVAGSRKLSLYQAAAAFALPTSQENFGLVLPEALACATPVVTTKGVDIWPELERSGGAVIVKRDGAAFADALEALLAGPDRRRAMGRAGRDWALRELDGARVVRRYADLYAPSDGEDAR